MRINNHEDFQSSLKAIGSTDINQSDVQLLERSGAGVKILLGQEVGAGRAF
jgi:hypothetical protein